MDLVALGVGILDTYSRWVGNSVGHDRGEAYLVEDDRGLCREGAFRKEVLGVLVVLAALDAC